MPEILIFTIKTFRLKKGFFHLTLISHWGTMLVPWSCKGLVRFGFTRSGKVYGRFFIRAGR